MKHPKNKQLSSKSQFSVLPTIEAAGNTLPPGLVLDPDADGGILTFIDRGTLRRRPYCRERSHIYNTAGSA